jgi:flagellar motor protein MotB
MGGLTIQYARLPETKRNSPLRIQRAKSSQQIKSPADRILFLQRTIGNQAVQRLIKSGTLQTKLKIGQPGDMYEQEADRVADAMMRMPEPGVQRQVEPEEEEEETLQSKPVINQITPLVQVQRQEEPEEEEEKMLQAKPLAKEITPLVQRQVEPEKEEEELQAKATSSHLSETNPNLESKVHSLRGGGQPLSENDRAYFEPRFGRDFSQVRVHTNAKAAESVNARAFTVGQDVVFGAGQYTTGISAGRRLLAHELTHVVQQKGTESPIIQRSIVVEDPVDMIPGAPAKENWEEVQDYIRILSPSFDAERSGDIRPNSTSFCATPSRFTDRCLCDLHNSTNPDPWKVKVDDIQWPHTEEINRRVTVHSTRSVATFGAWGGGSAAGSRISENNPRVLGHELCGHAWLFEWRIHPPFLPVSRGGRLIGRPSHDITVMIENRVAQEISGPGVDLRGTFSDPHHGESFARVTVSGFPSGSSQVSHLSSDMQTRIGQIKDFMDRDPTVRADIIGHADHTGSASVNVRISRRRARRVRNELVRLGISSSRFLTVIGKSNTECPSTPIVNPDCRKADVFMFVFEGASERSP